MAERRSRTLASATGWGGRVADQVAALNAASGFPVVTSLDGTVQFTTGDASVPLSIPVSGAFALQGYASGSALANARLAAVRALLAQGSANTFVASVQGVGSQALALSSSVNPILCARLPPRSIRSSRASPAASPRNCTQVAKMIAARGTTGARRQIFFVSARQLRHPQRPGESPAGALRRPLARIEGVLRRDRGARHRGAGRRRSRYRTSAARWRPHPAAAPTMRGAATTSSSATRWPAG